MTLTGLHHVTFLIDDVDKAAWFYGEVLQLPANPRPDFDFPGLFYRCGEQQIHLIATPRMPAVDDLLLQFADGSTGTRRYIHRHAAFIARDLPALRQRLQDHGVEILVDPQHVDADFRARIAAYRCGSGTFRMNVALSELPDFTALPGKHAQLHHSSGIVMAPSLAYMERAYFDARTDGWSRQPIVEILIPSTVDDTLAPPGMHVASLFCQHANPRLEEVLLGRTWDGVRDEVADVMIDTVNGFAPNFRASVLGRRILTPLDLEREFGLVGGDIFHGALSLDQLFSARPVLGHGNYRMPVRGLYLCGAGAHPGGGVTGIPGRNAAREILRDVRRKRF